MKTQPLSGGMAMLPPVAKTTVHLKPEYDVNGRYVRVLTTTRVQLHIYVNRIRNGAKPIFAEDSCWNVRKCGTAASKLH